MSTRRSFFAQLAGGLSLLAAGKFPDGPAPYDPKVLANTGLTWRANPAWVNAPYEVRFVMYPGTFVRLPPVTTPFKFVEAPRDFPELRSPDMVNWYTEAEYPVS